MGAINAPQNPNEIDIPHEAKGNPVYEQTRQDMPLWCCGRNCGRNSRITVFVLGVFGIMCSSFACLSPNYFSYVSLRNDTFCEIDKHNPKPFEFATQANVGLFRYEILEVFEFPWPPTEQCDLYAQRSRELEQLPAHGENESTIAAMLNIWNRILQNKFPDEVYDDDDSISTQNDTMLIELTKSPSDSAPGILEGTPVPPVLPGSNKVTSPLATTTPTSAPTRSNPNDSIDVEIGVVKSYPAGVDFDKLFTNGQKGALWAPILATIGLAFGTVEYYCCIYKCSWLPTALFLYAALMLQLMTLFLFMTQDFCGKFEQDCELGFAGFLSVMAVISYLICQALVCMTPRPPPKFDWLKKPATRRKKKKKKRLNEWDDETDGQGSSYMGPNSADAYNSRPKYRDDQSSYYSDEPAGEQFDGDNASGYYSGYGYGDDATYDGYGNDGYGNDGGYGYDDQASGYEEDQSYGDYEYTGYEQDDTGYDESPKSKKKKKSGKSKK